MKKSKYATSVITDIRNFSGIFEQFQEDDSDFFLEFLEDYYRIQSECASVISDDYHISTTGDGVLTIFLSEDSPREGYAFLLSIHRSLSNLCERFTKKHGVKTSFGVGADSGYVWDVGKNLDIKLDTYVGNVINRSSRIEAWTKEFGHTQAAIGKFLYNKLIKGLHPKAHQIMEAHDDEYSSLLNEYPEVVLLSKELMLYYVFAMVLKNIEKPLPIFRLENSLVKDDDIYWRVMGKLLPSEKVERLKEILP
jgi:class 3 adenylate cyclase